MTEPTARPYRDTVQLPPLRSGAASEAGPHRRHNEDAYLTTPTLFAVADGMGGHQAGEVASQMVVRRFAELAEAPRIDQAAITATLAACRADIGSIRTRGGAFSHPGTTLVVLAAVLESEAPYWLMAYLGDSRVYQWTPQALEQLSHDHSIVQELVDAGQITASAARTHRLRHVVTRSIDAIEETPADFALLPMVGESRMLLCSDGVTNELTDVEIEELLARRADPQATAEQIVAASVAAGGHDNATAVVVDVGGSRVIHDTVRRWDISEWPPHPGREPGADQRGTP